MLHFFSKCFQNWQKVSIWQKTLFFQNTVEFYANVRFIDMGLKWSKKLLATACKLNLELYLFQGFLTLNLFEHSNTFFNQHKILFYL